MNLWDTAGQEDYDHIRALAYKDVDCFLVCFSVDSQSSFSNVKQKWIPSIIDSESSDASIVLVGTKQDLRNDKKVSSALQAKGSSFVSEQDVRRSSLFLYFCIHSKRITSVSTQAKNLKLKIHADAYLECSALLQDGLKECMQAAVSASIKKRSKMKKKKTGCVIL